MTYKKCYNFTSIISPLIKFGQPVLLETFPNLRLLSYIMTTSSLSFEVFLYLPYKRTVSTIVGHQKFFEKLSTGD